MNRHDLDLVSLIFGIGFLGLASTGLFENVDFTFFETRWIWPVLLVAAGAIVLASSVRGSREATSGDLSVSTPDDTDA